MKKYYNITVNNEKYEVEIEEVQGNDRDSLYKSNEETTQSSQEEINTQSTSKSKVEKVYSPMPGNILSVEVSVGDTVSEGDVLLYLEAMKMENEIVAPKDGKVLEINISKGQTVNTGDHMVSLE